MTDDRQALLSRISLLKTASKDFRSELVRLKAHIAALEAAQAKLYVEHDAAVATIQNEHGSEVARLRGYIASSEAAQAKLHAEHDAHAKTHATIVKRAAEFEEHNRVLVESVTTTELKLQDPERKLTPHTSKSQLSPETSAAPQPASTPASRRRSST